jgi:hypothetical protein
MEEEAIWLKCVTPKFQDGERCADCKAFLSVFVNSIALIETLGMGISTYKFM